MGLSEPLIDQGVFLPVTDDLSPIWPWVRDNVIPNHESLRTKAKQLGVSNFSLEIAVRSYAKALSR